MFDLTTCKYIESLRTPIGQLQHLTKQQLTNCGNFKQFPQSIAKLSSLSMLDLFGCKSIESLLTTIGQLQHYFFSLSMLDSSSCNSIESLAITIGQLQHWTKLLFQRCENFKELRQNIASLSYIINLALIWL